MTIQIIEALHIISVISWMAGMLYLPRLYVYHAQATVGSELSETLKIMEKKLLRYIMTPAMIATFIFGFWLMMTLGAYQMGWMHAKLTLVLCMAGAHGMLAKYHKDFARDANQKSAKFFRILNEVPTLLLIIIVFLVVLKPF